jgi:branched-chain amino acid transport system ATP-binding protein
MTGLLQLSGISKRFGSIVVADSLDLSVQGDEALGILGPNGAGKTSLFGIITGTLRPDSGRVTFRGEDLTALPPDKRCRKGIARSFQIPQPFERMTVLENLLVAASFGRNLADADAYRHCGATLERCGLADKANRLAGALTLLDRKRLELARALASQPTLLLLDEVAGGLVEHECAELVALIKDVRQQGVAIVWIEHIVHALVAVVDRVVVLHGGRFIAEGNPTQVIKSPQVAEIYMGIPTEA